MSLMVLKFGGTSVGNKERLLHVAAIAKKNWQQGHQVVVVVSAQGDTTDELLEKAAEIGSDLPLRPHGRLSDIAPTMLELMHIEPKPAMTGESLIEKS